MIRRVKKLFSIQKNYFQNYIFYLGNKDICNIKDKADIMLMGTPSYGNLGDQLIAFAEERFIRNRFVDKIIIEVCENDIRYSFGRVRNLVSDKTIILLQGGGNICDVWKDQEKIREKVIKAFPNNKIIVLPQTAFFVEQDSANRILRKYKCGVTIFAREKYTYELLCNSDVNSYLCPDMALSLWENCNIYRTMHKRNGIAVCLRDDAEKIIDNAFEIIENYYGKSRKRVEKFSTVKEGYIRIREREKEIKSMLEFISSKELIITDRLHAMLMSYLTGTPCIALANSNKKIQGSFYWISNVENIYYTDDLHKGLKQTDTLINKKNSATFEYLDLYKRIMEEMEI